MTKIMIVDDEPDLRNMINLMLEKEGYETLTAENGPEFLEKVEQYKPDLVTLDVMMPDMTTKEILKHLQEKETNPKIILLTVVQYSQEEIDKILALGNIVEYMNKPFDVLDLLDKM